VLAHFPAEFRIKQLGISAAQVRNLADAEPVKIGGDGWSNTWDSG